MTESPFPFFLTAAAAAVSFMSSAWAANSAAASVDEADAAVVTSFGQVAEEVSPEEAKRRAKEKARLERLATRRTVVSGDEAAEQPQRKGRGDSRSGRGRKNPPAFIEHQYLEPSQSFLLFFRPWRLKVGRISFLQNTVKDLMRHHTDCRVVPAETKNVNDIVACPYPREFGADGEEVVFDFLKENDVLVGADYFFQDEKKAKAFARLIVREIQTENPTFQDATGDQVDSPLFRVSVQDAKNGMLVRITLNARDDVEDFEHYGRPKITELDFGDLKVGKTLRAEIEGEGADKKQLGCERTSAAHPEISEYHGQCFGFPYESHYQLNFDRRTELLQSVAFTPYGILSSNLVENALVQKYGEPKFCEKAASDVKLVRTNRVKMLHAVARLDPVRSRRLTVYAGACEKPLVFAVEDRFIFLFDRISPVTIERDFLERRRSNDEVKENRRELDKRRHQLNDFF